MGGKGAFQCKLMCRYQMSYLGNMRWEAEGNWMRVDGERKLKNVKGWILKNKIPMPQLKLKLVLLLADGRETSHMKMPVRGSGKSSDLELESWRGAGRSPFQPVLWPIWPLFPYLQNGCWGRWSLKKLPIQNIPTPGAVSRRVFNSLL